MRPLGDSEFHFSCHPGVSCFTGCCRNVDMTLYPYDIIRLKQALGIDSEEFLRNYVIVIKGENPYFPTVKLKLKDDEKKACPFLNNDGCFVYNDRPSACRTYPLERAVDRSRVSGIADEYYFLTNHPYCLGHKEENSWSVNSWIRNQKLIDYNSMNELWAELDTIFSQNPWKGEGAAGEKQQLAFMVCYNIDGFRRFADEHMLLKQFRLEKEFRKRIKKEDGELLKFGFAWLKLILTGKSSLLRK
ncbi:MAG: YkgJ family cysteine cluster protein [Desulforhopalus sp.]